MSEDAVIWHDLECGTYAADLPLWRELAFAHAAGPILEVGAGTGRVALDLATRGQRVIALERDEALAHELKRRARDLPIDVLCADACDFALEQRVSLCIVPMQTVQLLDDRGAFFRCARAALVPGGVLALALLGEGVQPFSVELEADVLERGGVRYTSTPTALRQTTATVVIERRRRAEGEAVEYASLDVVTLQQLDAATVLAETVPSGFALHGVSSIPPTTEHVGSAVLLLSAVAP